MNLFDLMGSNRTQKTSQEVSFEQAPSAQPVEDFSLQEKIDKEKELLGFYISEHPLKAIQQSVQILSPINLGDLKEQKVRKKVSTIVLLNIINKITTKQGKQMAFLGIGDISGAAEAVVFPETYEKIQKYLVAGSRLIIWGKVDRREDKTQLIVEDTEPIETVKMIMVKLKLEEATNPLTQNNLKILLQEQSGDKSQAKIPVIAIVGRGEQRQFIRFGQNYWVQSEQNAVNALVRAGFNAYTTPLIPEV